MKNPFLILIICWIPLSVFASTPSTEPNPNNRIELLKKEFRDKGIFYVNSSSTLFTSDVPNFDLQFQNASQMVDVYFPGFRLRNNNPAIVIDGMPFQGSIKEANLNIFDITSITVYDAFEASAYFGNSGGAVIIMTRNN